MDQLGDLRFHQLLVAIDGSDNAELAMAAAVTAALRDNASLTLIYVAPDVVRESARWALAGQSPTVLQEEADIEADRIVRAAVDRIPQDVSVTTVTRHGKPGPEIVAYARDSTFDAILMGARGLGRVGALIGSVSQYVMRHAEVPVFVAHAPPAPQSA